MTKLNSPGERDERILILAPIGRDAAMTARFLSEAGLAAVVCDGIEALCCEINHGSGVVLLTDEALTPEATRCLVESISQHPPWSDIPLVVLTSGASGGESPNHVAALATFGEVGNVLLIERPVRGATLLSMIKSALRARRRQYDVRDHLSEELRAKDEFLAVVSHELRTPLSNIMGWVSLLATGKLDEAAATEAMKVIERNTKVQVQLIEDILDVSRIITGKLHTEMAPLQLSEVIAAALEVVRPAANAKEISLELTIEPGPDHVWGDANRLQQVIWNLLSNAIKFTPKGGLVEVRLERNQSMAQITVRDTGLGMSPELLPHVFERFRQANSSSTRQYGGLGLGLAIVQHLTELHGGTVSAESGGEGRGSIFTVKLPARSVALQPDSSEPLFQNVDTERTVRQHRPLADLRVLVVDDEVDARELMATVLQVAGAEIELANSAAEALNTLQAWRPDLLISDIGMPEEDGYALIEKVRKLQPGEGGGIPAVALTAYAGIEDRLRALSAGYQGHVPKPVEPHELMAVLANLLRRPKDHPQT